MLHRRNMNGTEACFYIEYITFTINNIQVFKHHFIANIVLSSVLGIITTFGNSLVIVTILISQNLQTPSYLLITSLALTDLIVGVIYYPVLVYSFVLYVVDTKPAQFCPLYDGAEVAAHYLVLVSLAMSCFVSFDRIAAITFKHRYKLVVTRRRVIVPVVLTWIVLSLVNVPAKFVPVIYPYYPYFASGLCFLYISLTCWFYVKSCITLHRYTSQVQTQQPNSLPHENFDVAKYRKTLKTMMLLFCCFVLLNMVVMCFYTAVLVMDNIPSDWVIECSAYLLTLYGFNACINPVVYMIRFTDIRMNCLLTLKRCVRRL